MGPRLDRGEAATRSGDYVIGLVAKAKARQPHVLSGHSADKTVGKSTKARQVNTRPGFDKRRQMALEGKSAFATQGITYLARRLRSRRDP